jgi:hypothetical protein
MRSIGNVSLHCDRNTFVDVLNLVGGGVGVPGPDLAGQSACFREYSSW